MPLGLESFPNLVPAATGRRLYFDTPPDFTAALMERGYDVILLAGLPRGGLLEDQEYLKAKLQGIEEGTVLVSEAQLVALKASLELYFGKKQDQLTLRPTEKSEGLLETLAWLPSRYTLRGNTTLSEVYTLLGGGVGKTREKKE